MWRPALHKGETYMKSFVILKNGLCALVAAVSIHHAQAEFTGNTVFTDNMVLQRDQPLMLWDTATLGEVISISFDSLEFSATADANGDCGILIGTYSANTNLWMFNVVDNFLSNFEESV